MGHRWYGFARIEYWWDGQAGTLVYNSGNFTPTLNTWQTVTVDFNKDLWRDTASGESKTLAEWQGTVTGVGAIPSNFFYIGYGSTSGKFDATIAFADMVHVVTTGADTTWDFEGVVVLPPAPQADISMVKTLDTAAPYITGDTIQYTLTVANAGPDAAINVQVGDIPTNLTITSVASANCNALPCIIPTLASGATEVITVMAIINAAGAFDNAAGAVADEEDPDLANNVDDTGNGGTAGPVPTYSVGGTVSGLTDTGLVLQNNAIDPLAIAADGGFVFATELADGATYVVTVSTQPSGQTCTVASGSGHIVTADVTDVVVTCVNEPVSPGSANPIPTLSEWALILMSMLLGLIVFTRARRQA